MAAWRDEGAASEAAQVLTWLYSEVLALNEDGTVRVGFTEPETAAAIIASRISFHRDVSQDHAYHLVRRATIDSVKLGRTDPLGFLEVLRESEAAYLATPPRGFVLLTSLSASHLQDLPAVRLTGATVTLSGYPPRHFETTDEVKRHRWCEVRFRSRTTVRVHVRARTPQQAFVDAMKRLDLLRAFWNLGLHRGTWRLSMGGGPRPVNDLRLGPLHTVHEPNGKAAMGDFWYEPEFDPDERVPRLDNEKLARIKREEEWCRARLRRIKGRRVLEDLFIRYCRALDQANPQNAFLQTWSLLEDLTGNPQHYSDLIRRASYLYTDRWYTRLQLEEMRNLRNDLVHRGGQGDRFEQLVYQLKAIVEHYLMFFLKNSRHFRTIEDLALFLAQPTNREELSRRESYLRFAREIFDASGKAS